MASLLIIYFIYCLFLMHLVSGLATPTTLNSLYLFSSQSMIFISICSLLCPWYSSASVFFSVYDIPVSVFFSVFPTFFHIFSASSFSTISLHNAHTEEQVTHNFFFVTNGFYLSYFCFYMSVYPCSYLWIWQCFYLCHIFCQEWLWPR